MVLIALEYSREETTAMSANTGRYWTTTVSDVDKTDVYVRGYSLGELIGRLPFSAATFLLIRGTLPTPGQTAVMEAVLCSVLDYSLKKPGTVAARYCVSANPSMVAGIATAVLAVGEYTLAPDDAGRFIRDTLAEQSAAGHTAAEGAESLSERLRREQRRVPGFGHPSFRHTDPRAQRLREIAREHGAWGAAGDWYESVHRAYTSAIGKPDLVINEVGMMAAILLDMGFSPEEMTGIALLSSLPGVIAHISEELRSQVRIRIAPDETVDYVRRRRDLAVDLKAAGWEG
jgi:citrate synthase